MLSIEAQDLIKWVNMQPISENEKQRIIREINNTDLSKGLKGKKGLNFLLNGGKTEQEPER